MLKKLFWSAVALSALGFLPHPAAATTDKTVATYPLSAYSGGYAYEVAVSGNYAYIADDTAGLEVVNISTITSPTHVRTIAMPYMRRLTAAGSYLYMGDNDGLKIYSLADPSTPGWVGTFLDSSMTISHIAVSGNYVYLSGITGGSESHLQKIDVTSPVAPYQVGADVSTGLNAGLAVSGDYVYVAGGHQVKIYDTATLTLQGTFTNPDTAAEYQEIAAAGTKVYLPDAVNGFDVVDFSTPSAPTLTGHLAGRYSNGVAISGNYALVSNNFVGNLTVIDISGATPSAVDTYSGAYAGHTVVVSGTTAIMANGAGGLRFFDISNPVVVSDPSSSNPSSAPVITLSGSTLILKTVGDKFTDPGYSATDITDGTITANVVRTGTLNIKKVGAYSLTYTVTNSRSVKGTATRLVIVQPKLSALTAKKGKYTITVNKKAVQLKPYTSMPASLMAYKAVLTSTTTPYYVFLNPNATKPELVLYKSTGKIWKRYDLSKITKVGLNAKFAVDPATLTVLLAATSKAQGPSVVLYKLTSSGLTRLGAVNASTKKTPVTIALLRTYPFMTELVTYVKGASKPLLWYYHPLTRKMTKDTLYNTALLKWTSSKITLR